MSRLIDADAFIEKLQKDESINVIADIMISRVNDEPTAYDVEEVVAELEDAKEKVAKEDYCRTKNFFKNDCGHKDCFKCCSEHLINIVRKGGVE